MILGDLELCQKCITTHSTFSVNTVEGQKKKDFLIKDLDVTPCQIFSLKGHGALNYYSRMRISNFHRTNPKVVERVKHSSSLAGSTSVNAVCCGNVDQGGSVWYPDLGANAHVTPNSTNIGQSKVYQGKHQLFSANGQKLPFTHLGSSVYQTNDRKLLLIDIMVVPSSMKNLLSINKICINSIIVVFYSQRVRVLDVRSGRPIVEGKSKNGLYELPLGKHVLGLVLF